jgi:hypothetical protein
MKRLIIAIAITILAAVSASPASAQPEQRYIYGCYIWQARYSWFNTYIPLCERLNLPIVAKNVR